MAGASINIEWVNRTLLGNVSLLLGERDSERLSPFESAVEHALSAKGVDGSYALVAVTVNYHPVLAELQFNHGNAMPQPFVRTTLSVSVQNRVPNIRQMGRYPDEPLAKRIIEQSMKIYNQRARAIPYR